MVLAVAAVAAFVELDFAWWWLAALFLAFDVSAAGYALNRRVGALLYNAAHAYFVPAGLLLVFLLADTRWCAFIGLIWAFHVAVDRTLGYGLKHSSGFRDTHLGKIGR